MRPFHFTLNEHDGSGLGSRRGAKKLSVRLLKLSQKSTTAEERKHLTLVTVQAFFFLRTSAVAGRSTVLAAAEAGRESVLPRDDMAVDGRLDDWCVTALDGLEFTYVLRQLASATPRAFSPRA